MPPSVLPEGTHLFLSRYFLGPRTYVASVSLLLVTVLAGIAFFLAAGSGAGVPATVALVLVLGVVLGGGWYTVTGWHRDELNEYQDAVRCVILEFRIHFPFFAFLSSLVSQT